MKTWDEIVQAADEALTHESLLAGWRMFSEGAIALRAALADAPRVKVFVESGEGHLGKEDRLVPLRTGRLQAPSLILIFHREERLEAGKREPPDFSGGIPFCASLPTRVGRLLGASRTGDGHRGTGGTGRASIDLGDFQDLVAGDGDAIEGLYEELEVVGGV